MADRANGPRRRRRDAVFQPEFLQDLRYRAVYLVRGDRIDFLQARYHY